MARILVHLDTRAGLEEKITLHRRHFSRKQLLDYEGVPFRCRRCHKVGHLYKDYPLLSGVTSENSRGTKQQPSIEQNRGDNKLGDGDLIHSETPTVAKQGDTKKTNSRRKVVSTPAPPRTHSKTAEESSSAPGNESHPMTSVIFLEVMFYVLHSSLQPLSADSNPIPSIPCSISPPPPTFSTTPSSHRMASAQPKPSSSFTGSGPHPYHLQPRVRTKLLGLVFSPRRASKHNHQGVVLLRSNRPYRMFWQLLHLVVNAL